MTITPKFRIALCLTGTIVSPDDITSAIGIVPTATWKVGDPIDSTRLRMKHDGWKLELPDRDGFELEPVLNEMLNIIDSRFDRVVETIKRHHLQCEIACAIYLQDAAPSCNLTMDTLNRLCKVGATLDIDIILC